MKSLHNYLILAMSACLLFSCSATKNRSVDTDDVRPVVKTPGQSMINASGDGLSQSISPLSGNRGTGANDAVNISNTAINNARRTSKGQPFRLDSISDQDFLHKATIYVMMESNISRIAQDKSNVNDIKTYSKMIVTNHQQIKNDLKQLSASLNISIPDTNNANVRVMQSLADKGSASTTAEFNFKYVQMTIDANRDAIKLFENGAKSKTLKVVDFANKYLPTLKTNLSGAQDLTKFVTPVQPKQ